MPKRTYAKKTTAAKRLRTLERKVDANKTEVQINSGYTTTDLVSTAANGSWNGIMNGVKPEELSGRNYKTHMIKAALAADVNNGNSVAYRYRMILFSSKNDSSFENTDATNGSFPGPYDEQEFENCLNFDIDYKRWTIYADKMNMEIMPWKSGQSGGSISVTQSFPPLTVMKTFKQPKLVRLDEDKNLVTNGAIGLVIYRQSINDNNVLEGSVERVVSDSFDNKAPGLVVQHKWSDP